MSENLPNNLENPTLLDAKSIERINRNGTPEEKGELGERLTGETLEKRLSSIAIIRHNLLLPISCNKTAQIDHIVFAPSGVWVVETKYWRFWVYAPSGAQNWKWRAGSCKGTVYSPILQVEQHARIVADFLRLDDVQSVVALAGPGGIKTTSPSVFRSPDKVAEKIAQSPPKARWSPEKADARLMDMALSGTPEEIDRHRDRCRRARARSCGPR